MSGLRTTLVVAALTSSAYADSTSGVDVALQRSSYDANGVFGLEGARLMPRRDLTFKLQLGYARSPLDLKVPGIGTGDQSVLDYVVTLDMTFGMSITDRLAIGFDAAGYRTATGAGYGVRGHYANGMIDRPSTGLISLRPLSNIDPSASPSDSAAYLGDELAGPLDVRVGAKYALLASEHAALTAVGTVVLPFGDDEMLLGDRNLVYEPRVAFEWRPDKIGQTRVLANVGARIRNRTILEAYDSTQQTATPDNAKVILDVGSELLAGIGGTVEITPRAIAAAELSVLAPLPDSVGYGTCRRYNGLRCGSLKPADYWQGASYGDTTVLANVGALFRVSADVTATVMIGTGQVGVRGDDVRFTTGVVWSPQPLGAAAPGRNDRDGDGVLDSLDACTEDAEDKDGFQDEDGCPDTDNDSDGIADGQDACPLQPEDKDGFQDGNGCPEGDNDSDSVLDGTDRCPSEAEDADGWLDDDGCPDEDNDGDGVKDAADKCPNDAETFNGIDDEDGCPDVRSTNGPEERADRIDFKGQPITFDKANKPTAQSRTLLTAAASIIKARKLAVRIEVYVALGAKATKAQKQKDRQTATARARAIMELLVAAGVPQAQLQFVGVASDVASDRVDLLKVQPGATP